LSVPVQVIEMTYNMLNLTHSLPSTLSVIAEADSSMFSMLGWTSAPTKRGRHRP